MADGLLARLAGLSSKKRTEDIELPNQSGRVDPRIKRARPDVGGAFRQAREGYNALRSKGLVGGGK